MSPRIHEEDHFSTWLIRLQKHTLQALRTSGRPRADHDDIVSAVVAEAWSKGPSIMVKYPNASVYASVRVRHAAESYYRRERSQRGEGSRLFANADGTMAPGRSVVSADASVDRAEGTGRSSYERVITDPGFEDDLLDSLAGCDHLRRVLDACSDSISDHDLDLFVLNRVYGHTVVELAAFNRVTRETMSRRLSRISKVIDDRATWFGPPV